MDGATNLLKQPEFHDVQSAKRVLHALEREQLLEEFLGMPDARLPGLEVAIGREIHVEDVQDCSLVTAVYAAPGGVLGRIGVLGPRRMDYGRVVHLVEVVAEAVSTAMGQEAQVRGPMGRPEVQGGGSRPKGAGGPSSRPAASAGSAAANGTDATHDLRLGDGGPAGTASGEGSVQGPAGAPAGRRPRPVGKSARGKKP